MKIKDRGPIGFVFAFSMIIAIAGPVVREIFREIRFQRLSELDAVQEILVEPLDPFERFTARDYRQIPDAYESTFKPALQQLNEIAIESQNVLTLYDDGNSPASFQLLNELSSSARDLVTLLRTQPSGENTTPLITSATSLLEKNASAFLAQLEVVPHIPSQNVDFRNQLVTIRDDAATNRNVAMRIAMTWSDLIEQKMESIRLLDYVSEIVETHTSSALIDTETPYFSLPPEIAQEKENELLEFLDSNRRHPEAVLALINLYAEMRNVTDAAYIFRELIVHRRLPPSLEEIKNGTVLLLRDYEKSYNSSYLTDVDIEINENLTGSISEEYKLFPSPDTPKMVLILPFPYDSISRITVVESPGQSEIEIESRRFWKSSTVLEFLVPQSAHSLTVQYSVDPILIWDAETNKLNLKYGGIWSRADLSISLSIPAFLKFTGFSQAPDQEATTEESQKAVWFNPVLEYRFGVLDLVGYKNGLACEMISYRHLLERLVIGMSVCVGFLLITGIFSVDRVGERLSYGVYFLSALATTYFIGFNSEFLMSAFTWLDRISLNSQRIILGLLFMALFLFSDRNHKGTRGVRIAKHVFDATVVFLVIFRLFPLLDISNWFWAFVQLLVWTFFILSRLRSLSQVLEFGFWKTTFSMMFAAYFMWQLNRAIVSLNFSHRTDASVGLILGFLLIVLIGIWYIAHRREFAGSGAQTLIGYWMDWITLYLRDSSGNVLRVLVVVLIAVTFFFQSALLAVVCMVGAAFAQQWVDRFVNQENTTVRNSG